jgi:hypothetical protein
METRAIEFDGVRDIVALVGENGKVIEPPFKSFEEWDKEYCGAGWTAKIIPDTIFGVDMGIACFYHDLMFEAAERTSADFHHSNSVFLHNMLTLHFHFTHKDDKWRQERLQRIIRYYHAVDTGLGIFFFGGFDEEE